MDRQHPRTHGALRHAHLPPKRPQSAPCDVYRPERLSDADRTMAIACGCVDVCAGDAVCFTDGCDTGNTVRLHTPGIYYAAYTLHMPANQPLHTDMHLQLDDCTLPESCLHIEHAGTAHTHVHGHAMFDIDRPACLRLITCGDLYIHADGPHPVITLAVFRIG